MGDLRNVSDRRVSQEIVGSHPLMRQLYHLVEVVALTDVTVHIGGESGTGKEVVADAVHRLSPRSSHRFVKLNCSAIPPTLLESSLFGHVRGAFTDAHRDHAGYLEYAEGGTIFLDEIGDLSPEIQVKLLRLLQSKEYCRVGDYVPRKADVRIITATNRDLRALVHEGKIREDFFYRVHVFPLIVPPLRERATDIPLLAGHFISQFNEKFHRSIEGLSPEVEALFQRYPWPGNVRELENAIEHAFVVAQSGMLLLEHLPEGLVRYLSTNESGHHHHITPDEERSSLIAALEITHGNRTKAAHLLGISRVGLWKRLKRLGGGIVKGRSSTTTDLPN